MKYTASFLSVVIGAVIACWLVEGITSEEVYFECLGAGLALMAHKFLPWGER